MEAIKIVRESIRGIADYAYCVDDDIAIIDDDESIIDDDDCICEDDRDGLTPEEVEAYNNECEALKEFKRQLINILGHGGFYQYSHCYLWTTNNIVFESRKNK